MIWPSTRDIYTKVCTQLFNETNQELLCRLKVRISRFGVKTRTKLIIVNKAPPEAVKVLIPCIRFGYNSTVTTHVHKNMIRFIHSLKHVTFLVTSCIFSGRNKVIYQKNVGTFQLP